MAAEVEAGNGSGASTVATDAPANPPPVKARPKPLPQVPTRDPPQDSHLAGDGRTKAAASRLEMKRINALNLEPAQPKSDERGGVGRGQNRDPKPLSQGLNARSLQGRSGGGSFQTEQQRGAQQPQPQQPQQSQQAQQPQQPQQSQQPQQPQQPQQQQQPQQPQLPQQPQQQPQQQRGQPPGGAQDGAGRSRSALNPQAKEFSLSTQAAAFSPGVGGANANSTTATGGTVSAGPHLKKSTEHGGRSLKDILESCFERVLRERPDSSEVWQEAVGLTYRQVLGQPTSGNMMPLGPMPGGMMPGQAGWQQQPPPPQQQPAAPAAMGPGGSGQQQQAPQGGTGGCGGNYGCGGPGQNSMAAGGGGAGGGASTQPGGMGQGPPPAGTGMGGAAAAGMAPGTAQGMQQGFMVAANLPPEGQMQQGYPQVYMIPNGGGGGQQGMQGMQGMQLANWAGQPPMVFFNNQMMGNQMMMVPAPGGQPMMGNQLMMGNQQQMGGSAMGASQMGNSQQMQSQGQGNPGGQGGRGGGPQHQSGW